ncbi:hypothetical protein [Singulisphaera acidiphila]|uniref:Uncharacterized protein n=1 Tax=Singulisphaera acidiphila (strain ATCC BAA-1392 / DSM 18658 / VKM B-2454 / MOB10) TaxID=886293 RepID=L0DLG9_SINAD|nr:hypothetical protein [Singulisphaera acidiphila]AGA30087.1 hypothetical protein Sinac_5976 [Singulisphaera acidiphila DSM 18658]
MSRRKRNLTIVTVVLLFVAAEVGLQLLRPPVAYVRVVNQGGEPITNLRLVSGQSAATLAKLPEGETATLPLEGRGDQTLLVTFQQKNNSLSNFEIPVFNPAALQSEGFSLVLVIRQGEFERYQDDGEPSKLGRLSAWFWSWLEKSLESP